VVVAFERVVAERYGSSGKETLPLEALR
jgi:hypothetical protein